MPPEGLAGVTAGATQLVLYSNLTFALAAGAIAASAMERRVATTAAVCLVAGFVAGLATPPLQYMLWMMPALLGTAGAVGAVLVATARMPRPLAEGLALVLGWAMGIATAPEHGSTGAVIASIAGTLGGALLGMGLLAALLALVQRLLGAMIGAIARRVLGAWTLAIAMMMLALYAAPAFKG
ncbi:hypothetical protein DLJ53_02510 [Acuticoccus sediminis]|uniref:Uncharacterized protein n=1 Tax=Acuticoccus sediminis TaxID=2184697 RepID=A0A8B2NZ21_9HYPH|nr:hypothetical protein [Acuticoccus sediminis]RAI03405.1 hypothetical protein DLJ53_02510 [Acuticoccus sediminis]